MSSQQEHKNLYQLDNLSIPNARVVVVYTEWNEDIISELRNGVHEVLNQYSQIQLEEISVPGCVEIPFAIQHLSNSYVAEADAYIALGCVIRGDTPHFDYVCQSVTQGISILNTQLYSPIVFGILTVNTHQQAVERIGGVHGHKGKEAAITALKMLAFKQNYS